MKKSPLLPAFHSIAFTSLSMLLLGGGGTAFLVFFTLPTLLPRWLLYFFITCAGAGAALPFVYAFQKRFTRQPVPGSVLIRQALWFGILLDSALWLQLGRVLTNTLIIVLAGGILAIESLLRLVERSTFKPDENL